MGLVGADPYAYSIDSVAIALMVILLVFAVILPLFSYVTMLVPFLRAGGISGWIAQGGGGRRKSVEVEGASVKAKAHPRALLSFHDIWYTVPIPGGELQVLKGGPLAFSNAQVVFMELGNVIADYNTGAPSFAEKIAFMDNAGFVPFDIPEVAYTAKGRANRVLKFIDIVWVRRGSEYARRAQKVLNSQLWR